MAFNKPNQPQGPSLDQQGLYQALANILSHNHVGEWGSDHLQEPKSLSGWNYLAVSAIGRQAARAHGYVYQDASSRAVGVRKSAQARYGPKSLWKSLVQDGSANVVADGHWVAEMVHQPNRAQSGAMFQWEYIQQMHLHGCCLIFNRPSRDGARTAARYIIPMALTQPVYPGQDNDAPSGGVRIMPYAAGLGFYVNPFINVLQGSTLPIELISIIR